ncbi:interleukin-1 receptor type 1 [Dendropsophus ebraccatus]|uniref:interleukin-1 receptor type 1 n=1 Tax=Dendropsophus ebraccatus TaxID=150705 RepID=UPI00383193B8
MSGYLLIFTLYILTFMCAAVGKAEVCIDDGVEFDVEYARVGEPLYALCPLDRLFEKKDFNASWIRMDSQTEITSDRQARVHQDQKYLRFIPADIHDSGLYQCVFRNSTYCIKKIRRVVVFEYNDGLCYNHTVRFRSQETMLPSLTIECKKIDYYVDYRKSPVKWFKECQPLNLDGQRYSIIGKTLIINNVTMQDSGNYTCEVSLSYNGVIYNISRTTEFTILDVPEKTEPVVEFPRNNVIDVELGSSITLTCKVTTIKDEITTLLWTYSGMMMSFYTEDDRVTMGYTETNSTEDGTENFMTLNFTKVIEEDFNRKFYCQIYTTNIMFYVEFKKPDPNLQGFLIAFFMSVFLVVIISVIIIRIFKVDIVLWYRSFCFINTNQTVADGKKYDAYIMCPKQSVGSSSYEMDVFVLKVLPEVLEKQCAYRLFITGRDDLPGLAMADLVDEAISQSRRVIIVLGNVFCEKQGDDFEQKIAMYDALIRNKIKVILIEMEKITDYTNMPESIKYIKQKQGVVRWKGQSTEAALSPNSRFWKNIRYQMPVAPRHSDKELYYIYSE